MSNRSHTRDMAGLAVISHGVLLLGLIEIVICDPVGSSYGPPKKEETEIEIQKVEVYEVPWIGDREPSSYGPPAHEYGPPPVQATTPEYSTFSTTIAPINSTIDAGNSTVNQTAKERLHQAPGESSRGHYYIYHPTGLLQKVSYLTQQDDEDMTFSARLQYKNVEPVLGPIYTYDPNTYVFSKINRQR